MSHADAAAVVAISAAVIVLLALTEPGDAFCYLLAFPIWIVSRDLGVALGSAVAVLALAFVIVSGAGQEGAFGPPGYLALAAVLAGAVGAGSQAKEPGRNRGRRPSELLRVLTARPEVSRRADALSRRELEVLEMMATGAKNAEIAERFVISQNTVKSHVGQILKKLAAKNRTEAAFRYVELYGTPPSSGNSTATANGDVTSEPARIGAASALSATVADLRRKDRLMLRLQDGRDLEVPLLEQVRDGAQVGATAIVYYDERSRIVGWYLPDQELGVDLRDWAP
jgi:DNA-binding CsgD family transcriptional regulator